jgi:hypothetical protein
MAANTILLSVLRISIRLPCADDVKEFLVQVIQSKVFTRLQETHEKAVKGLYSN